MDMPNGTTINYHSGETLGRLEALVVRDLTGQKVNPVTVRQIS